MKTQIVIVAFTVLVMEVKMILSVGQTCNLQSQTCDDSTICNATDTSCIMVTATACVPDQDMFTININASNSTMSCDIISEEFHTPTPYMYYTHCPKVTPTTTVIQSYTTTVNASLDLVKLSDLTDCDQLTQGTGGLLCGVLIGFGCVITLLVFIIMILCLIMTCMVARGKRYKYSLSSAAQNTSDTQQPTLTQLQEQTDTDNQTDTNSQQTNLYHVLDPQYDTVERDRRENNVVDMGVHYAEPDQPPAKPPEHELPSTTKSQSTKLSQNEPKESAHSARYQEFSGPGHGIKSKDLSSHSSPPPSMPKYSSIHLEDNSEEDRPSEEIPLYSMPDMNKKKVGRQNKESFESSTALTMSQMGGAQLITNERTPSPPPPMLPPKPGQPSDMMLESPHVGEEEESTYAEVSSRPSQWNETRQGGADAQREHTPQSQKMSLAVQPNKAEVGNYPRSYSLDDFIASVEAPISTRKASDYELPILYDEPQNVILHSTGAVAPHERVKQEPMEEGILGYFMSS